MSWWLTIALQAATPDTAAFDLAKATPSDDPTRIEFCRTVADDADIVVCGSTKSAYRLPLPDEREDPADAVRDVASNGMAAITPPGRCGIFAGERRCTKREAARYGYGNGRDPITVLTKLADRLVSPDDD